MGLVSNFYAWKNTNTDPFGSDRTRKWNKDKEADASLQNGVDSGGKIYQTPESQEAVKAREKKALQNTAPSVEGRTQMNGGKETSSLGSGLWEFVA